jgi:hypothetical protein
MARRDLVQKAGEICGDAVQELDPEVGVLWNLLPEAGHVGEVEEGELKIRISASARSSLRSKAVPAAGRV